MWLYRPRCSSRRIVGTDPFTCAEAVEQESRLFEGEIVRIALRHIDIPFNPNDIRVVVPVLPLERGRIPAVSGVILLDVADERASVCNGAIPARPRHRRNKRAIVSKMVRFFDKPFDKSQRWNILS